MEFLIAIIIGGIIGWLASIVMKTNAQMGIAANIVVGIVGSALGAWMAGALGFVALGVISRYAVAVAGAVVLILVLKALNVLK
jgi:uncharacterized membrane protein YeaQ/YmgE (transglycosylase-associated protein family)